MSDQTDHLPQQTVAVDPADMTAPGILHCAGCGGLRRYDYRTITPCPTCAARAAADLAEIRHAPDVVFHFGGEQ